MILSLSSSYGQTNQIPKSLGVIVDSYTVAMDVPAEFKNVDESEQEFVDQYYHIVNKEDNNCVIIPYEIDISFTDKEITRGETDMFNLKITDSQGKEYEFEQPTSYSYSMLGEDERIYDNSLIINGVPANGPLKIQGTVCFVLYNYPEKSEEYSVKDYNGKTFDYGDVQLHLYTKEVNGSTLVVLRLPENNDEIQFCIKDKNKNVVSNSFVGEDIKDGFIDYETVVPKESLDELILSLKAPVNVEQISVPIDVTLQIGLDEKQ